MTSPRIFIDTPIIPGEPLTLEQGASRHLIRVLRLQPGDPLTLFNGDGHDYPARLLPGDRHSANALPDQPGPPEAEPKLLIHLGLAISKGERMDFAIQKAVELGVASITPLISERCVVRLNEQRRQRRLEHWRGVVIAACEQSGRRRLPQLQAATTLEQWLHRHAAEMTGLLLDPLAQQGLLEITPPESGIRLLVGPEGGLAPAEISRARQRGFTGIRLGPRILRTETAPLAAIAAMQTLWGDLGR